MIEMRGIKYLALPVVGTGPDGVYFRSRQWMIYFKDDHLDDPRRDQYRSWLRDPWSPIAAVNLRLPRQMNVPS